MIENDHSIWSEPFRAWIESDWWRERVERELGLHVHGVSSFGADTIAHRVVAAGPSGTLVLRLVRSVTDDCSIELVRLGDVSVSADEVAKLRRWVQAVLGDHVASNSGAAILSARAVLAYIVAARLATALHRNPGFVAGLPRTHHALVAVAWPAVRPGRIRLRRPVVLLDTVYDGDWGSYLHDFGTTRRKRWRIRASAPAVYHYSAFGDVRVADIQAALDVAKQLEDFRRSAIALPAPSFGAAFREFARRTLPLLEHHPGLAAPAVRARADTVGGGSALLLRIIPGREAALRRDLSRLPSDDMSPFALLPDTHAATFTEIAYEPRAAANIGHASWLLFTLYGDVPFEAQLERLMIVAPEVSAVWRHCTDCPDDERHLLPYLDANRLRHATTFSAYGYATVREIRDALRQRDLLLNLMITGASLGRDSDSFFRQWMLTSR